MEDEKDDPKMDSDEAEGAAITVKNQHRELGGVWQQPLELGHACLREQEAE